MMRTILSLTLFQERVMLTVLSTFPLSHLTFHGPQLEGTRPGNPQSHDVTSVSEARNRARQILANSR